MILTKVVPILTKGKQGMDLHMVWEWGVGLQNSQLLDSVLKKKIYAVYK